MAPKFDFIKKPVELGVSETVTVIYNWAESYIHVSVIASFQKWIGVAYLYD